MDMQIDQGTIDQGTVLQAQVTVLQAEVTELVDMKRRLEFYQEHVFDGPDAEQALALLLAQNAQTQAEIADLLAEKAKLLDVSRVLEHKLAVYRLNCVCFQE